MRWTVGVKLALSLGVCVLLIVGLVVYNIAELSRLGGIQDDGQRLNGEATQAAESASMTEASYKIIAESELDRDLVASKQAWTDLKTQAQANYEELAAAVDTAEQRAWLADSKAAYGKIVTLYEEEMLPRLAALKAGDALPEEIVKINTQIEEQMPAMDDPLGKIADALRSDALAGDTTFDAARTSIATLSIIVSVVGLLVALVFSVVIVTGIVRSANEMKRVAEGLAEGNLAQEVAFHSGDEMGQLADAFRTLIANLCRLIGQVAENATSIGIASSQLSSASEQAGQATAQVATTIQQVAKGTAQQSESVTKTATAVEQMSRTIEGVAKGAQEQAKSVSKSTEVASGMSTSIRQVSNNAQNGARSAGDAAQVARSGAQTVEETIRDMESIRLKVGLSAEKVKEMGQRSDQIGAIVETIDDIASQTNLLALNAAIEAARAGEHGKGFAVVADAVGQLAESAASATKEIAALIKGIQKTVGEAVQAMDEGAHEVESGVVRAKQAGQALGDILKTANEVSQQVQEIAVSAQEMTVAADELTRMMESVSSVVEENTASAEEMAASSDEVTASVENIAAVSEENSASAEEVSAATEEVGAQVEEVAASAQSLAEMAQALQAAVAQFTLPTQMTAALGTGMQAMNSMARSYAPAPAMPAATYLAARKAGNGAQSPHLQKEPLAMGGGNGNGHRQ